MAARALEPKNATVCSNLGTAYERRGDLKTAIEQYDTAIALRSDYANAFANRAHARYLQATTPARSATATKLLISSPGSPWHS